ncbi:MAG: putative MPP superfamily phosphohydrolase [Hyphomicrobiaceae bacterium]|jgi:predicted MPP superfamily phosphohydrolase
MRAWFRSLIFDHMSWPVRLFAGLMHGALAVWLTSLLFDLSPSVRLAVFVVPTFAILPVMSFSAPVHGRGRSIPGVRQIVLELAFGGVLLGGAVVASSLLAALADSLFPAAWANGPAAPVTTNAFTQIVVGLTATTLLWGFAIGRQQREQRRVQLPPIRTACSPRDLSIVHLSDLHLGNGMTARHVHELADEVAALEPDLIVFTGDLFDQRQDVIDECTQALAAFDAPFGVFAILGNHDIYTGPDLIAAALSRHAPSLHLLRNSVFYIEQLDLWIAGLEDFGDAWSGGDSDRPVLQELARDVGDPAQTLLLVHRPEAIVPASELGFRVVLAGHYHGGQLAIPGSNGRANVASALTPYNRGLHHLGDSSLYVSSGLGTAGPRLRVACPTEIAIHTTRIGSST